jgi:hypothetical protein
MQGVSLLTKDRGRHDVFELALTYDGIEIRRSGQPTRHLSWERVSEWEIEHRRGGVLLTLRGGGAVTPLVIPHWKMDDLEAVLRAVTSPPPALDEPLADAAAVASAGHDPEPEAEAALSHPSFEEVVSQHLAPPAPAVRVIAPAEPAELDPEPVEVAELASEDVGGTGPAHFDATGDLVWPGEAPLDEIPSLSWPTSSTADRAATMGEFRLPEAPVLTESEAEPLPDLWPVPLVATLPDSGAGTLTEPAVRRVETPPFAPWVPPVATTEPSAATQSRVHRRQQRRERGLRRFPLKAVATVVLLGLLATAVALVLAQSAGIIHLAWLGSTA